MSRGIQISLMLLTAVTILPLAFGQSDREGTKDYPGISRMPGYYLDRAQEAGFDTATFPVKKGAGKQETQVEGHKYVLNYYQKAGERETSNIQVIRNFENAAKGSGGQVLYEETGGNWAATTFRMTRGNNEIWCYLEARSDNHELTIVEKKLMLQEVTMDAAAMGNNLVDSGRVALYGLYFDTGKSLIKPESEPSLVEIAKLLREKPALKVFIVGHTDMVGDATANVGLSQARAQAVVSALTSRHGIASTRLIAFGAGPYAPVASNRDEDGRAKNRRVELVEVATR